MEDGAAIGGEAGGKLRHTILADFNSDKFMSVVRVSALSASHYIITGPGGWPRTVGHDLKFESTGGKMMLAPHSARRVETRRAE